MDAAESFVGSPRLTSKGIRFVLLLVLKGPLFQGSFIPKQGKHIEGGWHCLLGNLETWTKATAELQSQRPSILCQGQLQCHAFFNGPTSSLSSYCEVKANLAHKPYLEALSIAMWLQ